MPNNMTPNINTALRSSWLPKFSLRDLFMATFALASVVLLVQQGCELARLHRLLKTHGLAQHGQPTRGQFRLTVNALATDLPAVYEIVIETLGGATISTKSSGSHSLITTSQTRGQAQLVRSSVLVVVARIDNFRDSTVGYTLLVRPKHGGSFAGGAATYRLPSDKPWAELFELLIKPGLYPRGKPLPLLRFNDKRTDLLVK